MCLAYFPNQIRKRTPYVEHVFKAFYALRVTTNLERPNGCLPPVAIDHVVDEPDLIRDIARNNGPYFMPGIINWYSQLIRGRFLYAQRHA